MSSPYEPLFLQAEYLRQVFHLISCVVHIYFYFQIKVAQIISITLFILLWNNKNPCLWEKSILTINFTLSDICSCPLTFIWIVVYFGHILLFACNFGHKLCVKWVYLCKSSVRHPMISTISPNGLSSFLLCQSGQV